MSSRRLKKPAQFYAAMGDTGMGKSAWVKQLLAALRPPRRIVWDFKREYEDGDIFLELAPLAEAVTAAGAGPFSVIFRPSMDDQLRARQFDLVCRLAIDAGKVCFVVEELAFVTTPSRAPTAWKMVTLTGRHDQLVVIGTSQRPASIDKNFLSAATVIHTCCLGYVEDRKAVARHMGIEPEEIYALKELEWIEYDKKTKKISRDILKFR